MRKRKKTHPGNKRGATSKTNSRRFRIFVFSITFLLSFLLLREREHLQAYTKYGYFGMFIINFLTSATVLFPLPGVATVFVGGAIWNPILTGIVSGLGATIGELFGYLIGYGGRGFLRKIEDENHWIMIVEDFFHSTGFITTLIFSIIPFPFFDIIGIIAGVLNYPLWKFTLATLLGRIVRNIVIAWSGAKILQ